MSTDTLAPPDNLAPSISANQIRLARQQAQYLANKILNAFTLGEISKWDEIESVYGLPLADILPAENGEPTPAFRASRPYVLNLKVCLDTYVNNTERRLLAALHEGEDDLPKLRLRLTPLDKCYRFKQPASPSLTQLFPEQDPVFSYIYGQFWGGITLEPNQPPARALLQNGKPGAGKTAIAIACIDKFIAEGRHLPDANLPFQIPFPIIWITHANLVEQTRRAIIAAGLGQYLDSIVHVISYSDLLTDLGLRRFIEKKVEEDPFTPGRFITTYTWQFGALTKFFIIDEAHSIQNEDAARTLAIEAYDKAESAAINPLTNRPIFDTKFLFLTATPIEKVSDLRVFVCMTRFKFQGTLITYENFNTAFANIIANGKPNTVTKTATKAIWRALRHRIIELPRVKWPHKAINDVRLYQFETEEDRDQYDAAWGRHCERCRLLGKDPDAGAEYTSLMIFANEVEPIRAKQIVREMVENVRAGNTSVMATRFVGTIIRAVFILQEEYSYGRDKISIVWGGRKNIEPDRILTKDDMMAIFQEASENGGSVSRETKKLIELNLDWQKDALIFGDKSPEEQVARYERLKDLKLVGKQTRLRRQEEIDKFMSGQARFCFFTADSGGTGLSFEHASPATAQRHVWATPIYNGKQFTQVMGRCPRRISWTDSIQHICLMEGTVESEHVAPILDNKLQSAGEFTSQKDDIAMVLTTKRIRKTEFKKAAELDRALRTREQVLADAETEASQLFSPDKNDDEANDEISTDE